MADVPSVQVSAQEAGQRYVTARDSEAAQLARALEDFNPALRQLSGLYMDDEAAKAKQRAIRDANKSGALALADAVREGKIEATQNPWYIRAYEQEAANVRGRASLDELQAQSVNWEEKDDSAKFLKRWTEEAGKLGENFKGEYQLSGFNQAMSEITQKVVASNEAQNVARITAERGQNLSSLAAETISKVMTENGGKASPEQIWKALEPIRLRTLNTGGSQSEWDNIAIDALTSSAYNNNDPTLLGAPLAYDRGEGQGTLNLKPDVAQKASQNQYYVQQRLENEATQADRTRRAQYQAKGSEAVEGLYAKFGTGVILGEMNAEDITKELAAQNYSPGEIAAAIDIVGRAVGDSASLSRAAMRKDTSIVDLHVRATKEGYTDAFRQDVEAAVLNGDIDSGDAVALVNKAEAKNKASKVTGKASTRINSVSKLKTNASAMGDALAFKIQQATGKAVDSKTITAYRQEANGAAQNYLLENPNDFSGAMDAASGAMAKRAKAVADAYRAKKAPAAKKPGDKKGQGGNPLR